MSVLSRRWAVRLLQTVFRDSAARLAQPDAREAALLFDREWYSASYEDVRSSGFDPLVHYMVFGASEKRNPHPLFDASFYCRQHAEAHPNPLAHYLREGIANRYATHPERGFCLIPPLGRPLRILTLLVRYGTVKYPGADARLNLLLDRILPGAERRTVIIDNSLSEETEQNLDQGQTLISGDNSAWEFSGWDRGIKFAATDLANYDFIHFATDAFEHFEAEFPAQFTTGLLESLRFGPAIAGHIDALNEPAVFDDCAVQAWIRSSFFFLRPQEVLLLGSMVSVSKPRDLFTGDAAQPFRSGARISDRLSQLLTDWLTGDGLGQGVQWHSRFDLSKATLTLFEAKVVAILNELMLSERLRAMGCWLADVTWIRGILSSRTRGRLFEDDWRRQVRNRPAGVV